MEEFGEENMKQLLGFLLLERPSKCVASGHERTPHPVPLPARRGEGVRRTGEGANSFIRKLILTIALVVIAAPGCTTKSRARSQAHAAYMAGQEQGAARAKAQMQQQPSFQGPSVSFVGDVNHRVLPWTPDLTLAQAIIAAQYQPPGDPRQIVIIREGQELPVSPQGLLQGQDVPLLPGDVVEMR
jgi:hypothetical protein